MDTANGLNIASRIKIEWLSRLSLGKAHGDKGTIRVNRCTHFSTCQVKKSPMMISQGYALSYRSCTNVCAEQGRLLNKREKVNVSNGKPHHYPINYTIWRATITLNQHLYMEKFCVHLKAVVHGEHCKKHEKRETQELKLQKMGEKLDRGSHRLT